MHAIHNAALIRRALPRHLVAPKPFLPDRTARHQELAKGLQATGPVKRAETAAKTKATKAKNKAAKGEEVGAKESVYEKNTESIHQVSGPVDGDAEEGNDDRTWEEETGNGAGNNGGNLPRSDSGAGSVHE